MEEDLTSQSESSDSEDEGIYSDDPDDNDDDVEMKDPVQSHEQSPPPKHSKKRKHEQVEKEKVPEQPIKRARKRDTDVKEGSSSVAEDKGDQSADKKSFRKKTSRRQRQNDARTGRHGEKGSKGSRKGKKTSREAHSSTKEKRRGGRKTHHNGAQYRRGRWVRSSDHHGRNSGPSRRSNDEDRVQEALLLQGRGERQQEGQSK